MYSYSQRKCSYIDLEAGGISIPGKQTRAIFMRSTTFVYPANERICGRKTPAAEP
jgi:hypothetical protein